MSGRGPLDFGDAPERGDLPREPKPEPPAEPPPPAKPQGASRYGWFIGLAAFLLVVLVTINSIATDSDVQGGGPSTGGKLSPFAVPLAESSLDGDANLATEEGQDELGPRPACEVRGPEILNICQEWEKGPVVLALFPTDAGRCRAVLRQLERAAAAFPEVRFVAVGSRGDRGTLRGDWSFPVGWDRDGAVAARYGLVGCPQVTFAHKGGKVAETVRRDIPDGEFARKVRALR